MQINYSGNVIEADKGILVKDLLKDEINKDKENIIACKFNNEIKSLTYEIEQDGTLELVHLTDKDGMRIYKRGIIYIISKAFNELFPQALITVNYQLYNSMFCNVENIEVTEELLNEEKATKFYEKEKTLKGKLQLDIPEKKEITLYYCEDYYNYFYGVMPISTGIIKNFEIVPYDDGFLIRYPNEKNPNKLVPFKETPKLYNTLKEYDKVHKVLSVNTVYKLNKIIEDFE